VPSIVEKGVSLQRNPQPKKGATWARMGITYHEQVSIWAQKGQGFGVSGGEKGEAAVLRWLLCCRCMAPKNYYRRWEVWLRGEKLGEVLAATERAACLRAVQRFKIKDEDRRELEVRRGEKVSSV
jgi:hypothetical protein